MPDHAPQPPRYCPQRELPPYSYVTGLAPHPTSDPRGHSFGHHEPKPASLTEGTCRENATYLYGLDLFNHGFYWEAHEAWEALWHASGRAGPTADFLKGLIKLAAAGVKAREGRAAGVRQHAERAAELFVGQSSALSCNGTLFGLRLNVLLDAARQIAASATELAGDSQPSAERRLPVTLLLTD